MQTIKQTIQFFLFLFQLLNSRLALIILLFIFVYKTLLNKQGHQKQENRISKYNKFFMYQQKYESVLRNCEDSEEEQKIPENKQQYPISSFQQQLKSEIIDKEIQVKYQPICIVEKSINSVIIKCKLRASLDKQGQQQIQEEYFAIKIYLEVQQQAIILDKIMRSQQCKFLVNMKEFYKNSIVLSLYQGHLKELIIDNAQFTTSFICKIFKQCLQALALLQKNKIVHGDIKPENILYKSQNKNIEYFLLADFSSSFQIIEKRKKICRQTWPYRAPEWLKDDINIDNKIDIWSLGCVLFQCITGFNFLPLQIEDYVVYEKQLKKYGSQQSIKARLKRYSFGSQVNAFETVLLLMLQKDPEKRPTINFLIEAFQKIQ